MSVELTWFGRVDDFDLKVTRQSDQCVMGPSNICGDDLDKEDTSAGVIAAEKITWRRTLSFVTKKESYLVWAQKADKKKVSRQFLFQRRKHSHVRCR